MIMDRENETMALRYGRKARFPFSGLSDYFPVTHLYGHCLPGIIFVSLLEYGFRLAIIPESIISGKSKVRGRLDLS